MGAQRRVPSRTHSRRPIPNAYPSENGGDAVNRYRRLMVSLGWLAAFLMAAGAGWKTN